jgi:hypothetical protein
MFVTYLSRGFIVLLFACSLSGCGTKQTLDQAISCNDFRRLPDGIWSTTKDVSFDYLRDGTEYQSNYSKNALLKQNAGGETSRLIDALNKKCGPNYS